MSLGSNHVVVDVQPNYEADTHDFHIRFRMTNLAGRQMNLTPADMEAARQHLHRAAQRAWSEVMGEFGDRIAHRYDYVDHVGVIKPLGEIGS